MWVCPNARGPEKRIHYGATFAVLSIAALAFSLLQSMIIPAIPTSSTSCTPRPRGATWLLTAYLLERGHRHPDPRPGGRHGGQGEILVAVLIALSLGTLLSAVSTTLPIMLAGRAIQGTGGAVFPLAFGIIRDEFPKAKVSTGIGIMSAILGIGAGGGIILAGPIIEHLSYHWLFWIPLVMTLPGHRGRLRLRPRVAVRAPGRINWLGVLIMSAWLVTGLVAVSEGPTWGWVNSTVMILFGATLVLFALWVWAEVRSDSPVVDMKMMRIPAVWSTNLAAMLFGFGMFAMFITVPQFRPDPVAQGYGFGLRSPSPGSSCFLRRGHAARGPAHRSHRHRHWFEAHPRRRLGLRRLELWAPGDRP